MYFCQFFFLFFFFFFNDTATTEIYTLSLHDALPISSGVIGFGACRSTASQTAANKNRAAKTPTVNQFNLLEPISGERPTDSISLVKGVCRAIRRARPGSGTV